MTSIVSELGDIVNGCLNNNRLSQRQLYDRYASRMFVLCRRYADNDAEAEDMLMEGFMSVFKNLETFKGESAFETWIHSVMVKTAVSHYRSVRRFRNELLVEELDEGQFVEDEAFSTSMDARVIIDALQRMPETPRVVFNLKAVEDHSFTEIGKMLGKKESAVRVAFMRAREWLRKELGEMG